MKRDATDLMEVLSYEIRVTLKEETVLINR